MAIPLKAKRDFPYDGHRIRQGQNFDVRSIDDARFLKQVGYAEDRPVDQPRALTPPKQTIAPQTYRSRMMATEAPTQAVTSEPTVAATINYVEQGFAKEPDDLDSMDIDALHALASRMGVYVHHRAGAERVRQVIRDARKSTSE